MRCLKSIENEKIALGYLGKTFVIFHLHDHATNVMDIYLTRLFFYIRKTVSSGIYKNRFACY